MGVVLFAVAREGSPCWSDDELGRVVARLRPENLKVAPFDSHRENGVLSVVAYPNRYARAAPSAAVVGVVDDEIRWYAPGTPMPNFATALFRADAGVAEVVTDAVGSRTVWYLFSDTALIASTSQRMIVSLTRTFEANPDVVPWLLLSGGSGPGLSWDRRVKCLPPDATLHLDRSRWQLTVETRSPVWSRDPRRSRDDHVTGLRDALDRTFAGFQLHDEMVLPLSGGYDSRAILLFTRRHSPPGRRIRAITWGTRSALADPTNDASIARDLCRTLGVEHRYHVLDEAQLPFSVVFRRFVAMGEGRTDHIGGYVDGFALWQDLHDHGVGAVLRGDMGFGYPPALTERDMRLQTGIPLPEDFRNASSIPGLRDTLTPLPFHMRRLPGESCTAWNGRLGHVFRLPTNLAALSQLKTSFVEVANPLLARPLVEYARSLPAELYVSKRGFKKVVEMLSPPIPFARTSAIPALREVYRTADARAFLRELLGDTGRKYLFADIIETVLPALRPSTATRGRVWASASGAMKKRAKAWLPRWVASVVRSGPRSRLDPMTLAFRAAIVAATCDLLTLDAKIIGSRA